MTQEQGHILIVDDHKTTRLKLRMGLEQQGHTTSDAIHGRQALDILRRQSFDLVLLDILMPEMDGYEVLAEMKKDPKLRDIPVIVISAHDEMDSVVKGIELGAEDYLPKSFDPVLLKARITACLEKKRLRDQEIQYLRDVAHLTNAAASVEAETFDPESLASVAERQDELGQLARVFQRMAHEIDARQQRLKQQVQELRIEIDQARRTHQVDQITSTEYFQNLRQKAKDIRGSREEPKDSSQNK
ncbi:MAG: response regulator [Anaerolineae bacterium]|nr:response regulator [Anaerolineae bacterium]